MSMKTSSQRIAPQNVIDLNSKAEGEYTSKNCLLLWSMLGLNLVGWMSGRGGLRESLPSDRACSQI